MCCLNNSTSTSLFETYIINAVSNLTGPGVLYFFDNNCSLTNVGIIGTEGSVGILLSNSTMFNSRNILIVDCLTSLLAEINSKADIEDVLFEIYEVGVEVNQLSDVILTNATLIGGLQDFCIKDLSRILRDGDVVVAPSC